MAKVFIIVGKILTVVFAWIAGIASVAAPIALANQTTINGMFGIITSELVTVPGDEAIPMEDYKTDYGSIAELKIDSQAVAEEVVAEGAVLLENKNNTLPLATGSNVSLFDVTAVDPIWCGTGSGNATVQGTWKEVNGEIEYDETIPTFRQAFKDAGLNINEALWNWYSSTGASYKRNKVSSWPMDSNINGASWNEITTNAKTDPNYGDAAIFVLGRVGGEAYDREMLNWSESNGNSKKSYLALSDKEETVLTALKQQKAAGVFKKIILIINSSNQPELDWLTGNTYDIDAALWIGGPGQSGLSAVGKILTGDVNPSGKLVDTFWNKHVYNPVHANFGAYTFGTGAFNTGSGAINNNNRYVVYQEGVYLGYRYTETRYEDVVLGNTPSGSFAQNGFNYNEVVAYPFGYGQSYTKFSYSNFTVSNAINKSIEVRDKSVNGSQGRRIDKTFYDVSINVTNTGTARGKETVQFYVQRPYGTYDKTNGIEKPAVELVGFAKTKTLAPNESQILSFRVDEKYFAAYDANGAGTYVLTPGDYYLTAGSNAHNALNNILALKGKTTADGMTKNGESAFAKKVLNVTEANSTKYKYSDQTGNLIENLFDFVDPNRYDNARGSGNASDNKVTYLSRSNWVGTAKFVNPNSGVNQTSQVLLSRTAAMEKDQTDSRTIQKNNSIEYPKYETFIDGDPEKAIKLVEMAIKNIDAEGNLLIDPDTGNYTSVIPFDDERWQTLLDQLSWEETVSLLSDGLRKTGAIASVAKPETLDHNGPAGFIWKYKNGDGDNTSNNKKLLTTPGFAELGIDPETNLPNRAIYNATAVPDEYRNTFPMAFPSNPVVSATFNIELAQRVGEMFGEDGLWGGYNAVYGTGVNIHRSPFAGRAFEYYSEDGFLSGYIVAYWTRGIQSRGVYVYNKHFFLNEQEYNRGGLCTFANEQSCREIYLRAFEIPIALGDARAIMGGLNRVGMIFTGASKELMTDWLRGEAGLSGFVVSDWWTNNYMDLAPAILAGNDLPDGPTGSVAMQDISIYGPSNGGYGELAQAMRLSAHRILYTVAMSNAMNGLTPNSKVVIYPTPWVDAVSVIVGLTWTLFGLSAALFITGSVLKLVKR